MDILEENGGDEVAAGDARGSSGSSYISGHPGVKSVTSQNNSTLTDSNIHYSNLYFTNTSMTNHNTAGNGKIIITSAE